jgi:hypothetical protein
MKHYNRSWHIKIDVAPWIDLINANKDRFACPFSNVDSYLNIYTEQECDVQFFNLQHCDYDQPASKEGKLYIRYIMSVERKLGKDKTYNFLKDNYNKFCVETSEENFSIIDSDPTVNKLVRELDSIWHFDASTKAGHISRTRIVKLPANGIMPYHKDETSSENIRVICPLITDERIMNGFKDEDGEHLYHFPANGNFYTFNDTKHDHAVFNNTDTDRYALIFTVNGVDDLTAWDREYKKNKLFWEAWSRGI